MDSKKQIDANALCYVEEPCVEEKAVLDLASALHRSRSTNVAISWEAQQEAVDYYNAHGFIQTLTRMHQLESQLIDPEVKP
jgi:hypothetical protein